MMPLAATRIVPLSPNVLPIYLCDAARIRYWVQHQRIELLEKKRPNMKEICEKMMGLPHLGNAGSHSGEKVDRKDVIDGFDILERVLHDKYSTHDGELAKMVAQINKRKGPRKAN
ncbi:MAG TPA: DUF4145 domain-containing protein [Gemmataceae bacterium]|nr:DUF4145 domain-containing protein [Gemmataceae bacterium]